MEPDILHRWGRLWSDLLVAAFLLLLVGCGGGLSQPGHRELAGLWSDYRELPPHRALAIAGDPSRSRWVAGVASGQASAEEAERAALGECRRQRLRQRMQEACSIYAVGDEVIWEGK